MTGVLRWTSVLGLLAAGALALSACGGSDKSSSTTAASSSTAAAAADTTAAAGSGEFCDGFAKISDAIDVKVDDADPSNLGALFTKGADALKEMKPPEEIKQDWQTLAEVYEQFGVAFDNVDFEDSASLDKVGEALTKLQEKAGDIATASQAIGTYAAENC